MGAERVMGCSSEFQEHIFADGAELLTDGSLDVRTHAKRVFGELVTILPFFHGECIKKLDCYLI